MTASLGFVWDDRLREYDFGRGHPLAPIRTLLAKRLIDDFGLLELDGVRTLTPVEVPDDDVILRVHGADYVAAVKEASTNRRFRDEARGLGTTDDPVFENMHAASARVCAGSLMAAKAVHAGDVDHGINLWGGLHHAMPGAAEGFCVYNDIAVAIAWLLDQGVERVAYLDLDVHHGDGVEAIFWDDPRVMTISLHEDPRTLFPGSGLPTDVGGTGAEGTAVNLTLPAGTGDQGWLRALHAVVPDLLNAFSPQVLVSQHGVDTHFSDPLAHLLITLDGQRMAFEAAHRWAHRYAHGRWLAFGGGGYEWVDVVPRAWTHLVAIAAEQPIDPATPLPPAFGDHVRATLDRSVPASMTDGRQPWPRPFEQGFNPDDPVDASILRTREAVYPHWDLVAEPSIWF